MDAFKSTASRLRHQIIWRYKLSKPQVRALEAGNWARNMNVAWGLANRGLIKKEKMGAGERYLGFSQKGEDVAGVLRYTARVLKEKAS